MITVNLADKFARFTDHWSPKLVGQVNGCAVKLVKISGEFVWHRHDTEDEMFFVVKGRLRMKFRDGEQVVNPGEFIIVPHGVEHLPVADGETEIMLVEPDTTLNTGNVVNERTVAELQRI
jgi:mannose-6-phosphate isomerase-like protein (cupin superfamily)